MFSSYLCAHGYFESSQKPIYRESAEVLPNTTWGSLIDVDVLRKKWSRSGSPDWMTRRIEYELEPFKLSGISQAALDATLEQVNKFYNGAFTRYRVIEGKIYKLGSDTYGFFDPFMRTVAHFSNQPGIPDLPNIDVLVFQNDGIPIGKHFDAENYWHTSKHSEQAPLLAFARSETARYIVTIPDRFTMTSWPSLSRRV